MTAFFSGPGKRLSRLPLGDAWEFSIRRQLQSLEPQHDALRAVDR